MDTHHPIRSCATSVNICKASARSASDPAKIPNVSSAIRYDPVKILIQKNLFVEFLASNARRADAPRSSAKSFLLVAADFFPAGMLLDPN